MMPQVTTTLGRSHSSDAPGDDPTWGITWGITWGSNWVSVC